MHIEVLYANVGALGNPQAKIIGVKKTYQQHDIFFQVSSPDKYMQFVINGMDVICLHL